MQHRMEASEPSDIVGSHESSTSNDSNAKKQHSIHFLKVFYARCVWIALFPSSEVDRKKPYNDKNHTKKHKKPVSQVRGTCFYWHVDHHRRHVHHPAFWRSPERCCHDSPCTPPLWDPSVSFGDGGICRLVFSGKFEGLNFLRLIYCTRWILKNTRKTRCRFFGSEETSLVGKSASCEKFTPIGPWTICQTYLSYSPRGGPTSS